MDVVGRPHQSPTEFEGGLVHLHCPEHRNRGVQGVVGRQGEVDFDTTLVKGSEICLGYMLLNVFNQNYLTSILSSNLVKHHEHLNCLRRVSSCILWYTIYTY